MDCPRCGLENHPCAAACADCALPLQDAATAAAKRTEWEARPAALRAEAEERLLRVRRVHDEYLAWLRGRRRKDAILGAVVVAFVMFLGLRIESPLPVPLWLAIGAGAGILLNRWRGGTYAGAGIFAAAWLASVIAGIPFCDAEILWRRGFWLMAAIMAMPLLCFGYLLGSKLDDEHFANFFRA